MPAASAGATAASTRSAIIAISVLLRRPPPEIDPQLRLLGEMLARAGDAGRREGRQRRRAVLGERPATGSAEKALRSSDFGGSSPK